MEQALQSTEIESTVEDAEEIGISDTLKKKLTRVFNRFRQEKEKEEVLETSLMKSEERYRSLFQNSKDAIYITTEDGKIIDYNDALLNLLGCTGEEIPEMQVGDLYSDPSDREKFMQTISKYGYVKDFEVELKKRDGTKLYCLITSTQQPAMNGKSSTYQGILRDITAVKEMEKKRIALEKMKADFIVLNAHELGTPLMVINGYLDIIKDKIQETDDDCKDAIQHVERNLRRIEKLQKAMFNITLLEHDKFRIHPVPIFVQHIVNQVLGEMKIIAERKGISVVNKIPDLPNILADKERIRKVIGILVDNGIKYTPEGGHIEISGNDHDDYIEIVVKDDGIGIEEREQGKIFDEFYQIEDIMGHKDGFGLGLSLAKGIIEAHGGRIWVESSALKGSKFHVTIPKT